MAIKTFNYPACINAAGDIRFRIRKAQFGDGYMQVSGDGINPITRSSDLTFIGKYSYITSIIAFLEDHQGGGSHSNGHCQLTFPASTAARAISLLQWVAIIIH